MVSRRKILSRSRDDLHLDGPVPNSEQDEEDIWYNKEKLYKVGNESIYMKYTLPKTALYIYIYIYIYISYMITYNNVVVVYVVA